ncbi:hypothetical protein B5S28_g237 [[Candida] boidinii]|nr:hypothetical protein B5S28_g237 [[Candida] boidinii]OWB59966.1 hypothetical protein B5S29_g831 [[Candida] boidinii]OWB70510.1 hypothetical protein B5S31_g188 [[Candida] boidinii]OWB77357.1 hypothetical protein B5S32_g1521 [[Candida] boidinii]
MLRKNPTVIKLSPEDVKEFTKQQIYINNLRNAQSAKDDDQNKQGGLSNSASSDTAGRDASSNQNSIKERIMGARRG